MYKFTLFVASTMAIQLADPSWPVCNGTNGPNCRPDTDDLHQHKALPICNGTNGPNCRPDDDDLVQLPTCSPTITENCQPVCDEVNTVGCTESSAPIPPPRDRFEGKWTHDKAPN